MLDEETPSLWYVYLSKLLFNKYICASHETSLKTGVRTSSKNQ